VFSGSDLLCEFQKPLQGRRWIAEPARYPNIVLLRNLVQQMEQEPALEPREFMNLNTFLLRSSQPRNEALGVS